MRYLKIENFKFLASSPYEDEVHTHVGIVLHLLEMQLTLSLYMVCLVIFNFYVFTTKLLLEKHVKFNFVLKFPFGKVLQFILIRIFSYSKTLSNLWFYFIFV